MVDRKHVLPISTQAKVLNISRATVYTKARGASQRDLALMRVIDGLHLERPYLGTRGLLSELNRRRAPEVIGVGRKRMRTLMQKMGIAALCPKPGTSKPRVGHTVYPYLLRNRAITRANDVWALDTTYIPMRHGFVYLTAVVDVASRAVLSHRVATTLEAIHAVEVINAAFAKYGAPNIVNTDQGAQFTAQGFVDAVKRQGCQLSMDGKGAWRDNVFVERLWRTVKYERVYLSAYETVLEAKTDIAQYFVQYNQARCHSSLKDLTPLAYYFEHLPRTACAA